MSPLNALLGTQFPIIAAPMAGASGGALAAAVTLAGGFGFLAAGYTTPLSFRAELDLARSTLNLPPTAQLPIGVGFLCWRLELPDSPERELLSIALDNNVKAIWLAFGTDIPRWIHLIRNTAPSPTLIFAQISSLEQARVALNDWKVDVIVAQGIEAGGHGHSSAPPLLTLIPAIASILPSTPNPPPLLAAGGLSTGAHLAAILALGASGAAIGTRFLLSPESLSPPAQKHALIRASSTARTTVFDRLRGTLSGWPPGVDGRALDNLTVREFERGRGSHDDDDTTLLEDLRSRYSPEDPDRMLVWAGTGVALISVIKPAKDIVLELHQDAIEHLKRTLPLISEP